MINKFLLWNENTSVIYIYIYIYITTLPAKQLKLHPATNGPVRARWVKQRCGWILILITFLAAVSWNLLLLEAQMTDHGRLYQWGTVDWQKPSKVTNTTAVYIALSILKVKTHWMSFDNEIKLMSILNNSYQ